MGPGPGYTNLAASLEDIYWTDPAGVGGDYLLALLETAEPPEPHDHVNVLPIHGLWCEAAHILRGDDWIVPLPGGRLSELPAIARDGDSFLARCARLGAMRKSRYRKSHTVIPGDPTALRRDDESFGSRCRRSW